MKSVVFLAILALTFGSFFTGCHGCNPDGNGKPVCTIDNLNQPFRNFWDPTAYWWCTAPGAEPELRRCPSSTLYYSPVRSCVPASQWIWTDPCSE